METRVEACLLHVFYRPQNCSVEMSMGDCHLHQYCQGGTVVNMPRPLVWMLEPSTCNTNQRLRLCILAQTYGRKLMFRSKISMEGDAIQSGGSQGECLENNLCSVCSYRSKQIRSNHLTSIQTKATGRHSYLHST